MQQLLSKRAREPTPSVLMTELPPLSALDRLIFDTGDVFQVSARTVHDVKLEAIREAVRFHVENCAAYGRFVQRFGFDPEQLQSEADLASVPQFPTSAFKRQTVLSVPPREIVQSYTSSGTSGRVSVVQRDDLSLRRLFGSMHATLKLLDSILGDLCVDEDVHALNLGPSRGAAGGVWFSYVMSLVELMVPTTHYVRDDQLHLDEAIRDLFELLEEGMQVGVFGPPFLVEELADRVRRRRDPVRAGERLFVVTGGGWKRLGDQTTDRGTFDRFLADSFGLTDSARIRDGFNQVELNSVFFECEARRMHVPPWVHVVVRDPATLEAVAPEALGLMSYLDPTARSFPCFIIADDLGILDKDACPCGRASATVRILRRVQRSSHEGCALKIERRTTLAPAR